jgi:nucleoside-diphosphate-sugar epimerase
MQLPKADLEAIASLIGPDLLGRLRNKKIFITGGTGFFGRWLLEFLLYANNELALNCSVCVLTRNANRFLEKSPEFRHADKFAFIEGDIVSFKFPDQNFDFIVHAATDADNKLNFESPLLMIDTIANGTRRVLDFCIAHQHARILFLSSGAMYGRQPADLPLISENYLGAPDPLNEHSAYGEGKRMAELLCSVYARKYNLSISIARCFAFVGPLLPLNMHFAVGNFIGNCLRNEDIVIKSDGTTVRSYMYSADLIVWLITILLIGKSNQAYNIGSDQPVSIREIATKVSGHFPNAKDVIVEMEPVAGKLPERYVPLVDKAKRELGLTINFDLDTALSKTVAYYKNQNN